MAQLRRSLNCIRLEFPLVSEGQTAEGLQGGWEGGGKEQPIPACLHELCNGLAAGLAGEQTEEAQDKGGQG